jgi:hypothetical protein
MIVMLKEPTLIVAPTQRLLELSDVHLNEAIEELTAVKATGMLHFDKTPYLDDLIKILIAQKPMNSHPKPPITESELIRATAEKMRFFINLGYLNRQTTDPPLDSDTPQMTNLQKLCQHFLRRVDDWEAYELSQLR